MSDRIDRRRFLKVLGVTGGGAAVLSGCGIGPEPTEKLIPYLIAPEDQIPGTPTWYSTTCRECPAGCGLHAKVREGRVIKLEGNPDSPINHGRLCARGQAALQGLYNPDRVTGPMVRTAGAGRGRLEETTWDKAIALLAQKVAAAKGKGIVFVTGQETGAFGELVEEWMKAVGGRHLTYEPFGFEALREGNRLAFGTSAVPFYDFAGAKYILSFGADFMETWLSPVGFQNGFSRAHGFEAGRDSEMAKFVTVGPRMSLTGMSADEWIAVAPGTEGLLALAMAHVIVSGRLARVPAEVRGVGRLANNLAAYAPENVAGTTGVEAKVVERLAREFAASGAGLAVAGGMATHYPNGAEIVAAVNVLNSVAGAVGKTVRFGPDLAAASGSFRDAAALQTDVAAGKVALLLVHGANPVYSLGAFAQALGKGAFTVSFSSSLDETASAADLVLPDLHPLEQWNDARPRAGVYAPVMQPVFPNAMHSGDVVLRASGKPGAFRDYLQGKWRVLHQRRGGGKSFEQWWAEAVQHGGIYSEVPTRPVRLSASAIPAGPAATHGDDRYALIVFPHSVLYDGRGADKPWLQELPDPVSKIAWHGWVEVNPRTAAQWQVASGDVVLLTSPYGAVRAPVWITPSVMPGVLAVPTGQGHTAHGRYARDRSFNAFQLLGEQPAPYGGREFLVSVTVAKTGDHRATTATPSSTRRSPKRGSSAPGSIPSRRSKSPTMRSGRARAGPRRSRRRPRSAIMPARTRAGRWRSTSPSAPAARRA